VWIRLHWCFKRDWIRRFYGIPNCMLREYAEILAYQITSILNRSFTEQKLPHSWKLADIVPILKQQLIEDISRQQTPTPNFTHSFHFKTGRRICCYSPRRPSCRPYSSKDRSCNNSSIIYIINVCMTITQVSTKYNFQNFICSKLAFTTALCSESDGGSTSNVSMLMLYWSKKIIQNSMYLPPNT
jgi:hypothetical protein